MSNLDLREAFYNQFSFFSRIDFKLLQSFYRRVRNMTEKTCTQGINIVESGLVVSNKWFMTFIVIMVIMKNSEPYSDIATKYDLQIIFLSTKISVK